MDSKNCSGDNKVESSSLHVPKVEEIIQVLASGLPNNFAEVKVEIVDCPDLSKEPFSLAGKGLGGEMQLIETGGPPYLLPLVNKDKIYDIKDIVPLTGLKNLFIAGAGAGPWPYIGKNCELIANIGFKNGTIDSHTRVAKVDSNNETVDAQILPNSETRYAILANLFASEGLPGKVIKVHCKRRIGDDDFISSIRKTLEAHYNKKAVGLGGTFLLKIGKVKEHVMPDFSKTPLANEEQLNKWLHFYELSAPVVSVGTLVSTDIEGLDLRLQHFHSFTLNGQGGHYHYDITPETVEYLGYFAIASKIHRIDRPEVTHKIGRD